MPGKSLPTPTICAGILTTTNEWTNETALQTPYPDRHRPDRFLDCPGGAPQGAGGGDHRLHALRSDARPRPRAGARRPILSRCGRGGGRGGSGHPVRAGRRVRPGRQVDRTGACPRRHRLRRRLRQGGGRQVDVAAHPRRRAFRTGPPDRRHRAFGPGRWLCGAVREPLVPHHAGERQRRRRHRTPCRVLDRARLKRGRDGPGAP